MNRTATNRPHTTPGRRRVPAVLALAMTAGLALSACSADPADDPAPSTTGSTTTSSSSSPSPTSSAAASPTDSVSEPAALPPAPASAPAPAPELPANVVDTGGPCHTVGEVAQAEDGSALFCTDDPTVGPIWQPAGGADAGPGQASPGGPCSQEGIAVAGPDGTVLTCTLVGGGDTPGGLYWQ
ncbi:MAG TPA: hypothetical protein H9755_12940 [Candidatus Dietzia intestinigallinarum]|nr:hypothetical protein [Candidatus Dietzia intestinigallinarum]